MTHVSSSLLVLVGSMAFIMLTCWFTAWSCFLSAAALVVSVLCHSFYRSIKVNDLNGKGVLITGCDTGFGHLLALKLRAMGFTVFAGCLDDQSEGAKNLKAQNIYVLRMDVTSQEEVDQAKQVVKEHLSSDKGHLWALVNNAGLGMTGFVESCSMEEYQRVASVNLFGTIRVTKAFAPMIRRSPGGGRIVNVASGFGRVVLPYMSAYCVTKYGVEAFTDILRLEMKSFGVKVISILPGNFIAATKITQGGVRAQVQKSWDRSEESVRLDYGQKRLQQFLSAMEFSEGMARKDPSPVVEAMADAVIRSHPKDHYYVYDAFEWIFNSSCHVLPTFITEWLTLTLLDHTSRTKSSEQ